MSCGLRVRRDDIPKLSKREKTWLCHECGAMLFAESRPLCRKAMLAEVNARHAFAEAEADELQLDQKVKP